MAAASNRPCLSLCMIVRDNADTIGACLESIRPWVDEMIVVDTGSRDRTPALAAGLGARVHHFPWCDDFSAARNESFRHARGQWIFWMDSDDTIDQINGEKLRKLVSGTHAANVLGYVAQVVCPGSSDTGAVEATVVDHVKIVRNRPELRFEFRIHEQLLPSIRRLGGDVGWTDIFVVHSGADLTPEGRRKKCQRDLRLLELELKDRPDHPFALFNLGMTYSDMGEHELAAGYLVRCLAVAAPDETQVRKAHALLVHSYDQLGRAEEAWEACERALRQFRHDPELLFRRGKLAHDAGQHDDAVTSYRSVLYNGCDRHFTSIDPGILGYKARNNLALVYLDMNRPDLAEVECRAALAEVPAFRPAFRMLGQTLVAQRRYTTASILLEEAQASDALACDRALLEAELVGAAGDWTRSGELLKAAVEQFPGSLEPLRALCQLQFERHGPVQAVSSLEELVRREPDDPAARHNLGTAYLAAGEVEAAIEQLGESLTLRPDSPATQEALAAARDRRRGTGGSAAPEAADRPSAPPPAPDPSAAAAAPHTADRPDGDPADGSRPVEAGRRQPEDAQRRAAPVRRLNVAIVTVGYNLPGATRRMLDSAALGCRHQLTPIIFLHSRIPDKVREMEQLANRPAAIYCDYGFNRGLGNSWNEGILMAFDQDQDVVLVVNEDVVFEEGDVERLADAAHDQQDRFLVMGNCFHASENSWSSSEYGCFAVNRLAFDLLGCFDENFFPVYYEDSDYRRRARLAGLEPGFCGETRIRHQGSASLAEENVARQNALTYAANRDYYIRKWGGDGGQERFDRPFNDARFSYFIAPGCRHEPYPGYNRTDQHIVEF